jgi:ribosomal subunit interface protein
MRIEVKGRGIPVSEDLRERVEKKFAKIGRQVSDLAVLEVELSEEANPAIRDSQIAEVTLLLKGATLRAEDAADNMVTAINKTAEELARQVKRRRDKQRRRREARRAETMPGPAAG